jgi:hypothetical protein
LNQHDSFIINAPDYFKTLGHRLEAENPVKPKDRIERSHGAVPMIGTDIDENLSHLSK